MQIYVLNRARETLATTSGIYDDKHTLTLDAGSSSYEFKIDKADEASQYMDSGNYIVLQDDDGKTWLFTILDYEETQYTKTVYAEDAGIELLNKACDIWKADGPHSFEHYFEIVTSGTPWKLGVNQLAGLDRTLKYEGRDTGLGRLLSILKGFDDAECTFDVNVKMNAPCDFKINVYKQVGSDRSDVQMVYNHELNDIVKKESRAEFVTALCGVGGTITPPEGQETTEQENIDFADLEYNKDGLVTTKGDKFLRAVDANKRFNPGQTTYIEAFYEYDTQSASELLNRTITRLKTYSEPQYTYTADVKIIDSTLKIGDTVTIIDHDYNPALYLSARVAKLEKSYTDPSQNTIEFCNYRLLSSRLADKLAKLQTVVNKMPSASQVGKLESNVSNLSNKTEELASQITSANGKNTNFYGKTEPANPKNGDLWYKKLENGEIEMYQYQDGTWQLLASTADLTTVQHELDQAKVDMEQAKADAQTAYDEAIKATNTANGAKAQTAEALEQAKQANDSYTNLAQEVADNKASVDADYKQVHDSYTNLAKEVADNKASADADYQKAQADIAQANASYTALAKEVADNKASVDADYQKVQADVAQANDSYTTLAQEVADNKASADADYKQVHDNYTALAKEVADNKASADADYQKAQADIAQANDSYTALAKEVADNKINVDADYKKIQADVAQARKDLSNVTGTVAEVKKGQGELSAKVAGKVDNTVYQTYVEQTNQALSEKLVASDLQSYAKIADVKQTTDGLSASITKVQGDLSSLQIGGANLLDNTEKERSANRPTTGYTDIFVQNLATPPTGAVFTASFEAKATTDKTVIVNHFYDSSGEYADGRCLHTVTCQASAPTEASDGYAPLSLSTQWKRYWITWTWSQEMTQPDIHRVLIGRYKNDSADGTVYIRRIKFEKGNKATDWCKSDNDVQSQLNTLSGKITATSDHLSSVYTKSEVDGKLGTKVEQSTLTQTANGLSASIAGNTDKITKLTADVNGVKSTVASKVDNTVYQSYVEQTNQSLSEKLVASDLTGYAKTVDVTKSIDGVKTTVVDNAGKISTMNQTVDSLKTSVANAQGDIATLQTDVSGTKQTVANAQKDITSIQTSVSGVQTDITNAKKDITSIKTDISGVKTTVSNAQGDITSLKTSVGGVQADVKNAKGDITSIKTDVSGVKTTIADHAGKITQLVTDVTGVKSSVSSKVDKTVYQSYVTQTDKALSTKLTESDLNGYAKIADVKQTTDGLSASITKVQGDLAYKATTLVDKPEFSDGDVGGWVSNTGDWSSNGEPCVLDGSSTIDGYKNGIKAQAAEGDLYASAHWKPVASGSKWYVEALVPNLEPTGGKTLKANASLYYTRPSDGQGAWTFVDCGATDIAPQHWGWIKGYVTVPDGVTKVKPCISMKNADGTAVVAHVKYCQFTLVNTGVQSQLNTLSGKITATSDRLSSVYTKSETDAKLGTKVEQSTLTQTANGLSASITGNTDKITKLTADVNGVKTTVAGKVDNTVYQSYVEQTNQSLSEKLVASDLNGYAKTVDVTKSIDGVKTTVADNTGKISTMQTDINGVKSTVKNAQGDISTLQTDVSGVKTTVADHTGKITQLTTDVNGVKTTVGDVQGNVATLQADAKNIKATVSDHTGKISTVQTDVNGIKTNVENAQGDIATLQTDVSGVKTTVSDHTGKITQLTTDVNGVKSTVSSKVDKTTYQSYVTQTDKALSTKLTESDLTGYAKTTDLETRAGKIEASLTSLQGDMSYKATTLVDKPEFSDRGVGRWVSNTGDWSSNGKPCVLDDSATVDGYKNGIKAQTAGEELYADAHWKPVASGSKWYVEALVPNLEPTGGKTLKANASLYYIRPSDNRGVWTFVDCGATDIAPQHWGWIKGYVTVPDGVTKVKPCISMKNADGTAVIAHVKYCQFTLVNTGVQSQLNTLSGKITATSDRLSSVYTKSEVDGKLGTKVEQSALTQTSNNLSASIAKNSKILSSIGLTSDTAYINANKIALNGKTLMTNATINDAFIGNLSANKITTGTLNAAKVNVINLDASKITTGTLTAVDIHQSSAGADTWINEDGIHNQMGTRNVWIKDGVLAVFDSSGQGMRMKSGQLTLTSGDTDFFGKPLGNVDYGTIKYYDNVDGNRIDIIGKKGFGLHTENSTLNIGVTGGLEGIIRETAGASIIGTDDGKLVLGSLKPTFITGGLKFTGEDNWSHVPFVQVGGEMAKAGSSLDENGSAVVINAWDIKLNACGPNNHNIVMNCLTYNGEHSIDLNDGTSDLWWGPKMHAPAFVNTSALSKKMNIKKLDVQTAINAIKNTDIYDYQFKEFGETGKHYASLIIDDVNDKPQYKAAGAFVDGGGRDDGTQLGYLTVVVQSLLKEIDILKERIDK